MNWYSNNGADHDDLDDLATKPEPRVISVTLDEREWEVLDAIFVTLAWKDPDLIDDNDWDTIVELAKKLGSGDLRQL